MVDASVAVKWFKDEAGSEEAWRLLERHADSVVSIALPAQCVGEVLAVVARFDGAASALEAWVMMDMAGLERRELDDGLVREARAQSRELGCDFYDSLAPALASLLGAELYSADRRAHGADPGVRILE